MSATWLMPTRPYSLTRAHYSPHLRLRPRLFLPKPPAQRCLLFSTSQPSRRRRLLTLAVETSCDDTCVAILEKDAGPGGAARLFSNQKITSDNREFRGVHPIGAVASHTAHLAAMVREAMRALPKASETRTTQTINNDRGGDTGAEEELLWIDGQARRKPDFVTVTRGPGMLSNLATGLNTAKGLAVAWGVPLLGVNHMQAHALTPRLVSALEAGRRQTERREAQGEQTSTGEAQESAFTTREASPEPTPTFPFLSLLVSGGHSLLVLSRSLSDHAILAAAQNIAVGNMLDKCAREIVPPSEVAAGENVMYGPLLERFAFPAGTADYDYAPPPTRADEIKIYDSGFGWSLTPPLSGTTEMAYGFDGINGQVLKVLLERPAMDVQERRLLARNAMRLAFEHLASRLLFALSKKTGGADAELLKDIRTVVVAGGVASNRYLMHILRAMLDARGHGHVELVSPPLPLCTDNAAMIAWTGMEMYEAGWRSELDILALKKWPLDPNVDGGILGASGWKKADGGNNS
ncbi:glycoprotease family-domain-containing protein [Hypoxylon sp. FL0543]|nr:glycoprotease family-domain-containing protein [Hypoxylon sp. FL0543]